ncbi:MAG TPA: DUF2073 domain-containing protein [Candidatus Thermoplasmatota archaeon]|nr:DUF2073 domain-containing protein [Candidatus Thermoplasmatota archaeon]
MDVAIDLVSRKKLEDMSTAEKVRFIIDEVKRDKILVLEVGLEPAEEAKLIERTMAELDVDHFKGIEMESYRGEEKAATGAFTILNKFRKRNTATRAQMTVVGPANRLKTVKNDGRTIQAMIHVGGRKDT